jgi:N4-gp56 family major capsid protein
MSGQLWAVNSQGGFMYSDNLSDKLRMAVQPMIKFRQFADVKDAAHQGLSKGQTTIQETNTMPESNFTITQGTMTITEFGNSVPYTGKLDALSKHPVTEIINKVLKNDAAKAFDTEVANKFNGAALRYVGTTSTTSAFTTNGTATAVNTSALNTSHVGLISDLMKERNIPAYEGDDYYAIGHPTTFSTLKGNLESIHQYTQPGFQMIMNGEMGRYRNVRFVEQTNIGKTSIGTASSAWAGSSAWACFFGEDTVAEAIAIPEEMRGKIPTDYGRSKGIAWYYLGGFALVHDSINNYSPVANERVVIWDSAS